MMNVFFVYILKSQKDGGYYFGYTSNIETRLNFHNEGFVKSTKGRRPLVLHYLERFDSKSEALKREKFFKSIDGYNWLKDNGIT